MFTVTLKEKGGTAKELDFDQEQITIGRIQGNDIVLPKGNISKSHAKIVCKDEKFIIADLKSTNGTFVNGKKINAPQVILDADKVYIGDFVLTLQMLQASQEEDDLEPIEETGDPLPLDADVFAGAPDLKESSDEASSEEESISDELSSEEEVIPAVLQENDNELNIYSASELVQDFADDKNEFDELEAAAAPSLSLSSPKVDLEPQEVSLPDEEKVQEPVAGEFSQNVPLELNYEREAPPDRLDLSKPEIDQAAMQARAAVYRSVHKALASVDSNFAQDTDTQQKAENAAKKALEAVAKKIEGIEVELWAKGIANEIVGLGPIGTLFEQGAEEILVRDESHIFVRSKGQTTVSASVFSSLEALNDLIQRLCDQRDAVANGDVVSGTTNEGYSFTVLGAQGGPILCLCKNGNITDKTLDDLEKEGVLSHHMSDFLMVCLKTRRNILIVGANGADTAAFQNTLVTLISNEERLLILEKQKRLNLQQEQQAHLQVGTSQQQKNLLNAMAFTHFDRVITQGVLGPLLGGVLLHGGEIQSGNIMSCYGSSARDGLNKMGLAIQFLEQSNPFATNAQVANAIDIVVHVAKDRSGQDRVTEITEVLDVEVDFITLQTLFRCDVAASLAKGEGVFHGAGHPPRFYDDLQRWGMAINPKLFSS